jgi:hypothetical protein
MKAHKHTSNMAIINSYEKSPIDFSFVLLLAMADFHKKSQAPEVLAIAKAHKKIRKTYNPLFFLAKITHFVLIILFFF